MKPRRFHVKESADSRALNFILEKNKKHNIDGKRDLSQHTVEVQAVGFGAAGESLRHVVFFQFV